MRFHACVFCSFVFTLAAPQLHSERLRQHHQAVHSLRLPLVLRHPVPDRAHSKCRRHSRRHSYSNRNSRGAAESVTPYILVSCCRSCDISSATHCRRSRRIPSAAAVGHSPNSHLRAHCSHRRHRGWLLSQARPQRLGGAHFPPYICSSSLKLPPPPPLPLFSRHRRYRAKRRT